MNLLKFDSLSLRIDKEEASRMLRFFWPDCRITTNEITDEDRAFAQALLVEAIDRSYDMSYVELVFKTFFMKIPTSFGSLKSMIQKFGRSAFKIWFKHATQKDLQDPKIYENIRLKLAQNFRSVLIMRQQTGELIY